MPLVRSRRLHMGVSSLRHVLLVTPLLLAVPRVGKLVFVASAGRMCYMAVVSLSRMGCWATYSLVWVAVGVVGLPAFVGLVVVPEVFVRTALRNAELWGAALACTTASPWDRTLRVPVVSIVVCWVMGWW